MRKFGVFFPPGDEAMLSAAGRTLTVEFQGLPVDRLIVLEPPLAATLAVVVADYAGQRLSWGELRHVLQHRGIALASLEAANQRVARAPVTAPADLG